MSIEKYREDFEAYVATIESYGGSIGVEEGLIEEELKASALDPNNPTAEELKDEKMVVKNGMLVSMFISGANNELFGDLKMELNNDFATGVDSWPVNLDEAVQLMNAYKSRRTPRPKPLYGETELAFAQGKVERKQGWKNPDIICHRCRKKGHIAWGCTEIVEKVHIQVDEECLNEEDQEKCYVTVIDKGSEDNKNFAMKLMFA